MKEKRNSVIAWTVFVLIVAVNIGAVISFLANSPDGETPSLFTFLFPIVPILFAFVGALIISRQPHNVIGLVMMLPGLGITFVVDAYLQPYINGLLPPPVSPGPLFLIILWFSNWNWLLLVLPIMFIMLLFPTGHPLTPRWSWITRFGIGIIVLFTAMITFAETLAPGSDAAIWQVPNPIGFLSAEWIDTVVGPFLILFPIWILLCAVSLTMRFRRAKAAERAQIKWLFYATAIFILFYLPSFFGNTFTQANNLWNLLLPIGMATFPIAIAIAILRHQLYDIDIIIRRTIQYALVTGILALTYFGGIVILQGILGPITGSESSPVVTVITTLGIAALFTPLRKRVQDFIDRRFYRAKYDAAQTLEQFSATARDEVDMEKLSAALLAVINETMQPERASLWLARNKNR